MDENLINLEQRYLQELFTKNQIILNLIAELNAIKAELNKPKEIIKDGE